MLPALFFMFDYTINAVSDTISIKGGIRLCQNYSIFWMKKIWENVLNSQDNFSCWTCPLPTVQCPPWPCLLSLFMQCFAGSFCPRKENCANLPSENRDFLTEQLVKGELVSPSVEMILKVQLGGVREFVSNNIQTELSTVLSDKILILVSAAPRQLQYVCWCG